ncbi:MAG: hypothetical protein HYY44_07060 [Deltaproteobacteria bacterium]|nr:hypothetical protein [Deltaproteobacteria bacterium]MBI4373766.1 hypothetical protein [Deltaproteobacteria bacterium]
MTASLLLLIVLFFSPRIALAVPTFAVMGETQCSHCHVNPTGGGMRSEHGVKLYSEFSLRKTRHLFNKEFKGQVNRFIGIGGDIRLRHLSTIESPRSNSFTIPWGSLYVRADPIKNLTFYVDTDLANLASREIYGMVHNDIFSDHEPSTKLWIKGGRLNLPYGLRLPDDSSFIRSDLGLTFASQDLGFEVGAEPGPFTLALALTNGVAGGAGDDNGKKAVSWFSEWRREIFRVGSSFFSNDSFATRTLSGGVHTGLHLGEFTLLGEFDLQRVRTNALGISRNVFVGYAEIDRELIRGLFVKGAYDAIDDSLAGSGLHHRISGGVELFPIPYIEVDLLYRMRIGSGTLGSDQIWGMFHAFF